MVSKNCLGITATHVYFEAPLLVRLFAKRHLIYFLAPLFQIWCMVFITLLYASLFQHPFTLRAVKSELRRFSQQCVSNISHGGTNGERNENDITPSASTTTSIDSLEFHVDHDLNDVFRDNLDTPAFVFLEQDGSENNQKFEEEETFVCLMIQ